MGLPGDGFGDFGGQGEDLAERVDDEFVGGHVVVVDEDGPGFFAGSVDGDIDVDIDIGIGAGACLSDHRWIRAERFIDGLVLVAGMGR